MKITTENKQDYSDEVHPLLKEAGEFFRNRLGFNRLFELMRKKYISLGRIGGTVTLNQPNAEEHEELSRFFSTMYDKNANIIISLKKFETILEQTKFQGIHLIDLLEAYFNETIETAKMKAERLTILKNRFFQTYLENNPKELSRLWIKSVQIGEVSGSNTVGRLLEKERIATAETWMNFTLLLIDALMKQLENKEYKRLPFFAQEVAQNPHGLDRNELNYSSFITVMHWLVSQGVVEELVLEEQIGETTLENTNELLNQFYLYKDDIANFVSVYGFIGYNPFEWLEMAAKANSAINLPLREVNQLKSVRPYNNQPVVIVENSGVYSQLLSTFNQEISFICAHGHPNLATLKFIDLIHQNNEVMLYYAGDFDPEGLIIAQNLLKRYPRLQTIWGNYSDWYQMSSLDKLNTKRLNKLKNIVHPQLAEAKSKLQKNKTSFYQEQYMTVFEELLRDKIMKKESILE